MLLATFAVVVWLVFDTSILCSECEIFGPKGFKFRLRWCSVLVTAVTTANTRRTSMSRVRFGPSTSL